MPWDWKSASREQFERAVELLLERQHEKAITTLAPDGRGGDEGIDFLAQDKRTLTVYQLKHYPDGFKTSSDSRKRNTKESYDTALRHKPTFWVLVVPAKLTLPEVRMVQGFKSADGRSHPRRIRILDLPKLDLLLTKYPDVMAYLDREDWLAQIEGRNIEGMEAQSAEEVMERARALASRGDNIDPNWGMTVVADAGGSFAMPYPKHPRAQEASPLSLEFMIDLRKMKAEDRDAFGRVIGYGTAKTLTIPRSAIVSQRSTGPVWQWGPLEGDLALEPLAEDGPDAILSMELYDAHGRSVGVHEGLVERAGNGRHGGSVKATFYGGLKLEWYLPSDADRTGGCEVLIGVHRLDMADARDALALNEVLAQNTDRVVLKINGAKLAEGRVEPIRRGAIEDMTYLLEFASDMTAVLQRIGVRRRIPVHIHPKDRVLARVARLLSEGSCTFMPPGVTATATLALRGEPQGAEMVRQMTQSARAYYFTRPSTTLEIAGMPVELGPTASYSPSMRVLDAQVIEAALEDGTADGRPVALRPDPSAGIRVVSRALDSGPPESWRPTPWGLTGIEEHPAFAAAAAATGQK